MILQYICKIDLRSFPFNPLYGVFARFWANSKTCLTGNDYDIATGDGGFFT